VSSKEGKEQIAKSATKYHVKNTLQNIAGEAKQPWRFECVSISDIQLEHRLLVRIVIAKVVSIDALEKVLNSVPVYQVDDVDQIKAQSFSCKTWVQSAVEALAKQGAIVKLGDWEGIKTSALQYVEKKVEEGRWNGAWEGDVGVPDVGFSSREIVR
jgi:hypothetical protein